MLAELLTGTFRSLPSLENIFEESEPYEEGFAAHYSEHIAPLAVSYEKKRLAILKNASMRTRVALVLFIIAFLVSGYVILKFGSIILGLFILIPSFTLLIKWIHKNIDAYRSNIKDDIFPKILSYLGDFSFNSNCLQRISQWTHTEIIPNFNKETNEDLIQGEYKGVKVDLFQCHLKNKNNDKNHKTQFKGIVINFSMEKYFIGKTILRRDNGIMLNFLGRRPANMKRVVLEDPQFESFFEVHSTDQIESRCLLTPAFMEQLKKLVGHFKGNDIDCCFHKNNLFLMIDCEDDLFEPGSILEPENFVDDAKNLLREMYDIFAIIDILKLNKKTNA